MPRAALCVGDLLKITFHEMIDIPAGTPAGRSGSNAVLQTFYQRMDLSGDYAIDQEGFSLKLAPKLVREVWSIADACRVFINVVPRVRSVTRIVTSWPRTVTLALTVSPGWMVSFVVTGAAGTSSYQTEYDGWPDWEQSASVPVCSTVGVPAPSRPTQKLALPPCDPRNPSAIPEKAATYEKLPPKTEYISVELTYRDGTTSEVKTFPANPRGNR